MPSDFQIEIFKRAEKNSRFMRSLGIGLGKIFPFIDKESQSELFARARMILNLLLVQERDLAPMITYFSVNLFHLSSTIWIFRPYKTLIITEISNKFTIRVIIHETVSFWISFLRTDEIWTRITRSSTNTIWILCFFVGSVM